MRAGAASCIPDITDNLPAFHLLSCLEAVGVTLQMRIQGFQALRGVVNLYHLAEIHLPFHFGDGAISGGDDRDTGTGFDV